MSECGVCIGGGDYDGTPEFCNVQLVKSRKEHLCCECRRAIPRGVQYERQSGKFDGELFCEKVCLDCVNIRDGLSCGETVATGTLWNELADYGFASMTTGCLAKVETASAKAYLMERWLKWKGLSA